MKLEFLYQINEFDEHAVRLSDFNSAQARAFRDAVQQVVLTEKKALDVHTLDFVESVNCLFTLRIAAEDLGIEEVVGKHLYCDLTTAGYKNMVRLLEPFCNKESKGYEWLYDIDTPIGFLFSAGDQSLK
ncbi:hypothetical protein [Cytophaga hutchinsonii]|uniref:Uncharacterized protein n=1 Tax=Cytophaga hutchinsonii (strain ATCC 33406 / DSM 1761 / CIP 103989 / NBRC 15051 / NCIMB 9469 / D465) TaxID=269798 RepID=A0A6N4SQV0_CYTH3|nr:hypothetical protein [Cytophaga hutchinsonii]ABG58657.1 hypothetical protein CHU_1386 [Cytophaga hutchinsonii ATCC 33406]SFX58977.1 hypothetical protein SAMN04487930_10651 [Cytophaga hutchinsonii ATCC 33406]